MNSEHLKKLQDAIKENLSTPHPIYPTHSLYALNDERVAAAVEKRVSDNQSLIAIKLLEYDFFTGLIPIYFEFQPRPTVVLKRDAVLAILDQHSKVVGVVDPFNPEQPNMLVPPLPKEGEQPFVTSRPSITTKTAFNQADLVPRQIRNNDFFAKLNKESAEGATRICRGAYQTPCEWSSESRAGPWETLQPTGFPTQVDDITLDYDYDTVTDGMIDDCGY